jgi:rhodanese-related sulfurtransferase
LTPGAKKEMPATIPGVKNITGAELKKMVDSGKAIIISDNRVKEQYDAERIKGAKWLLADHLVADEKLADQYKKDDTIILYCNGITCWRSPATAVMLQSLGFKNLYWYRDGIPDWKSNKFPTE